MYNIDTELSTRAVDLIALLVQRRGAYYPLLLPLSLESLDQKAAIIQLVHGGRCWIMQSAKRMIDRDEEVQKLGGVDRIQQLQPLQLAPYSNFFEKIRYINCYCLKLET